MSRTKISHWVKLFFGVKVIAMNSHLLSRKDRSMLPIMRHTIHYRRKIHICIYIYHSFIRGGELDKS